jgi:hypothetical protein
MTTEYQRRILRRLVIGESMIADASIGIGLVSLGRKRVGITTVRSLESKGLIRPRARTNHLGGRFWEWSITKAGKQESRV